MNWCQTSLNSIDLLIFKPIIVFIQVICMLAYDFRKGNKRLSLPQIKVTGTGIFMHILSLQVKFIVEKINQNLSLVNSRIILKL